MRPSFLIGLKIGTPLTATAMAPLNSAVFADTGCCAKTGWRGMRKALSPVKSCGKGTCCCQAVIPTIIRCTGKPVDSR